MTREPVPREPLARDPIAGARRQWREHGWGDAADGMAAVTSIMRAQQILLARADAVLKPFGLSFARFEMLRLLGFAKGQRMQMNRARALLQVHPTSVTNLVDRLAAAGLVRRVGHPEDGRAVVVELTDDGAALVASATEALNRELFADLGLDPAEVAALDAVLTAFRQRSGDFASGDADR